MESDALQQELNSLRIRHGTLNVYNTLRSMMRTEYRELHSLFAGDQQYSSGTCQPLNTADYYNEFMELNTKAANETLEEQCYALNMMDLESVEDDNLEYVDMDENVEDGEEDGEDNINIGDVEFLGLHQTDMNTTYSANPDRHLKIINTMSSHVVLTAEPMTPTISSDMEDDVKEIITEPISKKILKKKKKQTH